MASSDDSQRTCIGTFEDISYFLIPAKELLEEGEELFIAHWEEVPMMNNKEIGLNLDWDRYIALEAAGHLLCLAAYSDTKPVGYVVIVYSSMQQHAGMKSGMTDVIYVGPEYRKSGVGAIMIKLAEKCLKGLGVDFLQVVVNCVYDFSKLPEMLGYDFAYKVYNKRIQ